MQFELLLQGGKVVTGYGSDPIDAATQYVDANPTAVVIATRQPWSGPTEHIAAIPIEAPKPRFIGRGGSLD